MQEVLSAAGVLHHEAQLGWLQERREQLRPYARTWWGLPERLRCPPLPATKARTKKGCWSRASKGNGHGQIYLSHSHLWTGVLLQFARQKEAGGAEELQPRDPDPACSHVAVHEMDGQVEGLISQIQILLGAKEQRYGETSLPRLDPTNLATPTQHLHALVPASPPEGLASPLSPTVAGQSPGRHTMVASAVNSSEPRVEQCLAAGTVRPLGRPGEVGGLARRSLEWS